MKQDTCRWLEDDNECGKPAIAKVTVKGRVTRASVPVCKQHKAEHDLAFAKARTGRK